MFRELLRTKLHHIRVTEADIEYTGSLSLDSDIMDAAGIVPWEKLLIANIENGARFETYAIPKPPGSKTAGLNGGAARLGAVGDRLIVMVFGVYDEQEEVTPKVIVFDADNNIKRTIGG
jgi:aspartate 1-decarboxylase